MHCTPFPLTIDYLAARGALKVNLPLVITPFFHFENPAFYNHYLSDLLKRANAVFACTNIEKKKIVELGVKSSKIHVIPMGIEPTEWTNASGARFKEKYGLEGSYIVFFAGTKSYDKGAISLLRAMRIVQKKKKNVVLVTAGFGFREWLREKEKLKDVRILDLTYLSGGDKYDAFDACDIFAMPSRSDAFGISYLEAWICGKPVIGCKAGATPEVIQDGADGLLVGFGEVKELAERILYLLENPGFSEDLGTRGKEFVLSNYTWKSIVEKVEGIYRNTINEHRKML
jgi:glycosyltransferase involved in cell wall biosynthesis